MSASFLIPGSRELEASPLLYAWFPSWAAQHVLYFYFSRLGNDSGQPRDSIARSNRHIWQQSRTTDGLGLSLNTMSRVLQTDREDTLLGARRHFLSPSRPPAPPPR